MVLIISGTNRKNSNTAIFSRFVYQKFCEINTEPVSFIDLADIETHILSSNINSESDLSSELSRLQDEKIIPADKWVLLSPEYNGGFPGILKWFLDVLSVRKYTETFAGKKLGMIGVSAGRSGNLRGMEALTGIFNYLKITVYPDKLPVSSVSQIIDTNRQIEPSTQEILSKWVTDFLQWSNQ